MSYLEEFQRLLEEENLTHFLRIWEEYCMADEVDGQELTSVLEMIKKSTMAPTFGQFTETVLPLWQRIENPKVANDVLRLILDLQTINSPFFADLATSFIKKHYGEEKDLNQKLRIVGLLTRQSFRGAISNFELLNHMEKGHFVFHTGGWGVGEVVDSSLLREHVLIEFEGISAIKDLSFENAFHHLIILPSSHFLSRRFGNPDALEKMGKEHPDELVRLLLKDLGPKNAQGIKEELAELVIPEKDWSKWWQAARAKIKKDTKIQSPKTVKEPFVLREEEMSHDVRFQEALSQVKGVDALIQSIYNFTRDFPEVVRNVDIKDQLKARLTKDFEGDKAFPNLSLARKMQIAFLLEDIFPEEFPSCATDVIKSMENFEEILNLVDIVAYKKRALVVVREHREDWMKIFLRLLFSISQNTLRDYIFNQLQKSEEAEPLLREKIHELLNKMTIYPDAFFWYFQKIADKENVPFNDKESQNQFLEALFILLHFVEFKAEHRELCKKIHQLITAKRYAVVRSIIEGATVEFLGEFLLLASKCQSFSKHDLRILHDLSEVVQPQLAKKKDKKEEIEIIWTTQEGYQKVQERIKHIGTVETVENAKEIEAARALGDLRENAEFKFALEKRARLQSDLQTLSRQINQARILTKDDISFSEVGVGSVVQLVDDVGNAIHYTILGPWDADPDKHILSFQSKFAQAMCGHKSGEEFVFQGKHYTVKEFKSFL